MNESQNAKTFKKYLRMLQIWSGARWGDFVRRTLEKGRWYWRTTTELAYRLAGYRKPSLMGDASPNSKVVRYGKVPLRPLNNNKEIDLSGSQEIDQGRIGACAKCTICATVQDEVVKITKNAVAEVLWNPAWEEMKTLGLADDKKGSYLEDNLWYGQTIGYDDRTGNRWKVDTVEKISRKDIEKYVRMGYQIFTGALVGNPMCDQDWVFRTGQRAFGHAFRIIGITHRFGKMFLVETTWKNYGYKKESQFFIRPEDTKSLFSCYVMTVHQDDSDEV